MHGEVKAEKRAAADKNREIQAKLEKKEQLLAQILEIELQIKKLKHEVDKLQDNYKLHAAKEKEYSKKCNNENALKQAQSLSEQKGQELEKKIRNIQERKNVLSRTVNSKAQAMYELHEKEVFASLIFTRERK